MAEAYSYCRYRCRTCGFGGEIPLDRDPDKNDFQKILVGACAAIERHANGRKEHMKIRVTIDGLTGSYESEVNPRDHWKNESAKMAADL